jgi:aminoacyl tRNA synthase complex-interacting multifunctional protein 1
LRIYVYACLTLLPQSKLQPSEYYSHPALTRYFDHIQSHPTVRKSADALSSPIYLVPFDLANPPTLERKSEPSKKKDKAKPIVPEKSGTALPSAEPSAAGERKTPKKEKKDKKLDGSPVDGTSNNKAGGGKVTAVPAGDAGEPVPSMIDLRVGRIIDGASCCLCLIRTIRSAIFYIVQKHPDADGLYVEVRVDNTSNPFTK